MWLMPAILDSIGVRSQNWNVALCLFDFKSLFSLLPHGALGRGGIFQWSGDLMMPDSWTKFLGKQ